MENPDRRPQNLILRENTKFPAMYEGRTVGKIDVPAGKEVRVVDIEADVVVVRFREGTAKVPYDATNLREAAAAEMAKPAPTPAPEIAEAPTPTPAAVIPKIREDQLGAMLQRDKSGKITGTTFRVWAPNAESVSVVGSFNSWKAARDKMTVDKEAGVWTAEVARAKPGDEYMFMINGDLERRDPRGREVSAEGKSVINDPADFDWEDTTPPSTKLSDLVIYQLHPGTFHDSSPNDGDMATLRDAIGRLDHLKDLGVNCVLLMPVNEFTGRHSWGYNPSDLFAVESAYGGPEALKEFVKACHERGIAVHMDIVHNHYGPGDLDLWQFDGHGGGENSAGIYFYEDNERGLTPWGPRPDFGRPEVVAFVEDQVRMWFDEYRIDGLRWDSTINIRAINDGAITNPEGERLLDRLARMIRTDYPDKISIAEDSVGDRRFDASWEYTFHTAGEDGVVPQLLRESDEAKRVGDVAQRVESELGFRRVIYTENHDETGRLNGKRRIITEVSDEDPHCLKARRKNALAAVLTLTAPGVPLIFMGQELLEPKEFHDSNPLVWRRGEDAFRSFLLHRDLVHLRRNLAGLSAALTDEHVRVVTTDEENKLLVFRRYLPSSPYEDLLVVVNMSGRTLENVPVRFPQSGEWSVLLNTDNPRYGRDFSGAGQESVRTDGGQNATVTLAPYSAQIFAAGRPKPSQDDINELRAAWEAAHGGRLFAGSDR
jgi:1,4-alpha-glucan branching enzyme